MKKFMGGNKMIKISAIITAHNTEQYIVKCLNSVVNQTLSEFEVIVVDDASTDHTYELVSEFAEKYNTVVPLRLKNSLGPGGARNRALEIAKGEYVAFIDSDDWIDLNYFEKMYKNAKEKNADTVACGLIREYDFSLSKSVYKCQYEQEYILSGEIAFRIMTNEYNYGIKYIPSSLNKIYRKSFLIQNNIFFPSKIFFEDQPFSYKSTLEANKIICIPDVLYHHYKRNGSIVQSFSRKNIDDMITAYMQIREYLYGNNIYEKYRFNYYSSLEHFYNLIVRQIFEFVIDEVPKKELLKYSFSKLKDIINIEEYIDYLSAEELRKHIQPNINDTTIY